MQYDLDLGACKNILIVVLRVHTHTTHTLSVSFPQLRLFLMYKLLVKFWSLCISSRFREEERKNEEKKQQQQRISEMAIN